jgi:hypothetical protein
MPEHLYRQAGVEPPDTSRFDKPPESAFELEKAECRAKLLMFFTEALSSNGGEMSPMIGLRLMRAIQELDPMYDIEGGPQLMITDPKNLP